MLKRLALANNQRGMLAIQIMLIYIVFFFVAFVLTWALAQGARIRATETYYNFQQALDYAVAEGATGKEYDLRLDQARVTRVFMSVFGEMINSTPSGNRLVPRSGSSYPGAIEVVSVRGIHKGESIPGGQAKQDGFFVELNVPVFKANVPLIGEKYVTVPMKYFSVIQALDVGR
ncbi:MAG: hypothetical protein A4E56_01904 [Pelotomaculum sp. PtaU1.Bin065]|nr:MAG: hypothetical protein A4E56_01904 [Pelotomaculum sp. PtaU1.Bin065]